MALRWPLEGHFELFWALVAKWLSDGPWRLSLSCCGSRGAESSVKHRVQYSGRRRAYDHRRRAQSIVKMGESPWAATRDTPPGETPLGKSDNRGGNVDLDSTRVTLLHFE